MKKLMTICVVVMMMLATISSAGAAAVTDLEVGKAVLYTGATAAELTTWSTAFTYNGTDINAKHIAITGDFRLYNEDFIDNEAYGLNISTNNLVNIMSPFFKDPTGLNFEYDIDRGDAQWALSYYESRGPLETDYGRTSRNSRPVASYVWGTISNISQNVNMVTFDMMLDSGLIDGTKSFGVPMGAAGWHVEYDSSTLTGNATVIPEPATICLLGLGALSLIRKKSKK